MLAEWTGLEPATPGVTGRYSNQLNYHSTDLYCIKNNGSSTWARTRDLRINSPALYQLSYRGIIDLMKKPNDNDGLFNLVAWGGIEPPTQGFSILCSTD